METNEQRQRHMDTLVEGQRKVWRNGGSDSKKIKLKQNKK